MPSRGVVNVWCKSPENILKFSAGTGLARSRGMAMGAPGVTRRNHPTWRFQKMSLGFSSSSERTPWPHRRRALRSDGHCHVNFGTSASRNVRICHVDRATTWTLVSWARRWGPPCESSD